MKYVYGLIAGVALLVLTSCNYQDVGAFFQPKVVAPVKVKVVETEKTIMLHGGVYEQTFKEFMSQTQDSNITHYIINIHTDGGNADSTVGMMNRIKELKAKGVKFTTVVYAKAFSAGSYIFMMGDERVMYDGSMLMWHTMRGQLKHDNKWNYFDENRKKMFNIWDDFVTKAFGRELSMLSPLERQELMEDSGMSWMSARDAYLKGVATKVIY